MRSKLFIVALVMVFGIASAPQARAFQAPLPVAPPIVGICSTPQGAIMCLGAAAAVGTGLAIIWLADLNDDGNFIQLTEDQFIGMIPDPSTNLDWCLGLAVDEDYRCVEPSEVQMALDPDQIAALQQFLESEGDLDPWADQTEGEPPPLATSKFQIYQPTDEAATDLEALGFTNVVGIMQECTPTICVGGISTGSTPIEGEGFRVDIEYDYDGSGEPICGQYYYANLPNHSTPYFHANSTNYSNCQTFFNAQFSGFPNDPGTSSIDPMVQVDVINGPCSFSGNGHRQFGTGPDVVNVYGCREAGTTMTLEANTCASVPQPWPAPDWDLECGYVGLANIDAGPGIASHEWFPMVRTGIIPDGWVVTITQCQDGQGNITPRLSSSSGAVSFDSAVGLPGMDCLPGELPVGAEVQICDSNTFQNCMTVSEWELPGTVSNPTSPEYSCIQALATPTPCPMWVETWDGDDWIECELDGSCEGWWESVNRETHFRCGWGGNYYSASQCVMLKDYYDVGTEEQLTPVVNPAQPNPDPTTVGTPTQIGGPVPQITAQPTKTWLSNLIGEWATGSTSQTWFNSCWPSGWGLLNPLQWVLRPIVCALTFLFVPTTPVQTQLEEWYLEQTQETKLGLLTDTATLLGSVSPPAVGGACGWGFDQINTPAFTIPPVDVIMCPSELGVSSTAATARGWGYAVVGFWTVGMLFRWLSLGRTPEAPLEAGSSASQL